MGHWRQASRAGKFEASFLGGKRKQRCLVPSQPPANRSPRTFPPILHGVPNIQIDQNRIFGNLAISVRI